MRCKSHEFEFPIGCGYVAGAIGDFHIVLFSLPTGMTLELSVIGILIEFNAVNLFNLF